MRRFREVKEVRNESNEIERRKFEERMAELDKPIEPATKSIKIDTEIIQNHIDKCDNIISFDEFEERFAKLDNPLF